MLVITDTPIIEKTYLPSVESANIPDKLKEYLNLKRKYDYLELIGAPSEELKAIQNLIDDLDKGSQPTTPNLLPPNMGLFTNNSIGVGNLDMIAPAGHSPNQLLTDEVLYDGKYQTLKYNPTEAFQMLIELKAFNQPVGVTLKAGSVYTLSAMVYSTGDYLYTTREGGSNFYPLGCGLTESLVSEQDVIGGQWQLIYATFKCEYDYDSVYYLTYDHEFHNEGNIYIAWFALCEGNVPIRQYYEGMSPAPSGEKTVDELLKEYASIVEQLNTPQTYTFSTVGVLDNIYVGVTSYQMPLSFIDGTTMATIHAEGNFADQLLQVESQVGDLIVYIYDNYNVGYNYSGQYRLTNVAYLNGETTAVLNFVGNAGATFFGAKYFPATTYSQVVYKYRNQITFNVYEYTQLGVGFVDKLITTVVQEMPTNGINYINLSEITLPYVQQTGGRMIRIEVTEKDFFGNTDTVQGRPLTFIYGSLPEVNYYKYILFNPVNGGTILPTTVDKIYFNEERIYPFYINFILQDEGIPENGATAKILFKTYIYEGEEAIIQDEVQDLITVSRGLNTINIANVLGLLAAINKSHDYIIVQIGYETGYTTGQFTEEFTAEFVLSGSAAESLSNPFTTRIERRTFNDRRDFYLQYNSGIGGLSTILSTNYEESIEPEVVSLRNREVLNNTVVRSTEIMNVTFDQANLDKVKELLGFEPSYMFKVNGIYESSSLTRIGADLSEKEYIIRNATYNKGNQELYNTVNIELFRPMNAGFQQIGSVEINTFIVTEGVTAGMIQIILELTKIENLLITSCGFTTQDGNDYNTYEFNDDNYFVKQEVAVKAQANNMIIQSFARTSQGIRYGKQLIYKG